MNQGERIKNAAFGASGAYKYIPRTSKPSRLCHKGTSWKAMIQELWKLLSSCCKIVLIWVGNFRKVSHEIKSNSLIYVIDIAWVDFDWGWVRLPGRGRGGGGERDFETGSHIMITTPLVLLKKFRIHLGPNVAMQPYHVPRKATTVGSNRLICFMP